RRAQWLRSRDPISWQVDGLAANRAHDALFLQGRITLVALELELGRQPECALEVVARVPIGRLFAQHIAISLLCELDERQRLESLVRIASRSIAHVHVARVVERGQSDVGAFAAAE